MLKIVFLLLLLSAAFFCEAVSNKTRKKMIGQLEAVAQTFDTAYAPAAFKKEHFGWTMDEALIEAKDRVFSESDLTIKKFQQIFIRFLKTTRDIHVSSSFYSTEAAALPFRVMGVDGRYFISEIDEENQDIVRKIKVGDEIVTWNHESIESVIQEYLYEQGGGSSETSHAFAEAALTHRESCLGDRVINGEIMLGIRSSMGIKPVRFTWGYIPEKILTPDALGRYAISRNKKDVKHSQFSLGHNMKKIYAPYEMIREQTSSIYKILGYKESKLPFLGIVIWQTPLESPFHAYIFIDAKMRKIGFIRIPEYDAQCYDIQAFREIIAEMQRESDALVIDQLDNPGGSVLYSYAILANLTDYPLSVPQDRLMLVQKNIMDAYEEIEIYSSCNLADERVRWEIEEKNFGFPAKEFVEGYVEYCNMLISEWERGELLTKPIPLMGFKEIQPHAVCYTKPILFLVNELSMSSADSVPAILQDNHRAVIMGRKTAGAGGCLSSYEFPNFFGIREVNYTSSIAYRKNQEPLETLGVVPDVIYEKNIVDITQNNKPFARAILEQLDNMLF